ncbi:MAG: peptide deformylase [Verrucomicrobiota bacterium]|jgi:peptide deformylase
MARRPPPRKTDLEVKIFGSKVLRRKAEPVTAIDQQIRDLAARMVKCMYEEEGIGLAAPQVGVSLRIFVIDTRRDREEGEAPPSPGEIALEPKMPFAVINPEITWSSPETCDFSEGCLSIPGVNGNVVRPKSIRLKGRSLDGEDFEWECGGLLARCAQHEIDHLDGILFTDRAEETDMKKAAGRLAKLKSEAELLEKARGG